MRISLIQPSELGLSEIQAWHSMQLETGSLANPFLCPEFSLGVGKVQSAARVAVLTEGSGIVGFFRLSTAVRYRRSDRRCLQQLSGTYPRPWRGMGRAGAAQGVQAIDLAIQQAGTGSDAIRTLRWRSHPRGHKRASCPGELETGLVTQKAVPFAYRAADGVLRRMGRIA